MKGDFSRLRFDPSRQYVGTLMQQGRIQLDADWNEQQAIHRHQRESGQADIIGPRGAPKVGGGFAITLAEGAQNLAISPGRLYVDGILVRNDAAAAVLLTDQPFLKLRAGGLVGFDLPAQSGRYLAYLDVWERHITGLEDPNILEVALGGPDTTTRVQIVWQVRLEPVAANASCAQFNAGWAPTNATATGSLKVSHRVSRGANSPCVLPPASGYQGLENQLYRVEIHRSGSRDQATFKWSRNNASVATTVNVSGQVLLARDLGRDEILGFAKNQWVELVDARMEETNQRGHLLQVEEIDRARREITIHSQTPVPAVDTGRPLILRRWDNPASASADGISLGNIAQTLESDVEIEFGSGTYRSGDYWLIPARTAIGDQAGIIDWPRDSSGAALPRLRDGIARHYCPLALVDFDNASKSFGLVSDCRPQFPALTRIAATDVSFDSNRCNSGAAFMNAANVQQAIDHLCTQLGNGCTFVITPQTDLRALVDRINTSGIQDAQLCFKAGRYEVDKPLVVGSASNPKGSFIVSGLGVGSQLIARNAETFLRFENCASVVVRDLYVEGQRIRVGQGLGGALTFVDCQNVVVESSKIRCASNPVLGATGITAIRLDLARPMSVNVEKCELEIGMEQTGMLVVDADRVHVENNRLSVAPIDEATTFNSLLQNHKYRTKARRTLVRGAVYQGENPYASMPNAEIIAIGGAQADDLAYFLTDPSLVGHWQEIIEAFEPIPTTVAEVRRRLHLVADNVLLNDFDRARFPRFAAWRNFVQSRFEAVAAQGIVVAGSESGGEVCIVDNTISGFQQGIRVGYSRRSQPRGTRLGARGIQVKGNRVTIVVPPFVTHHSEAIFVGSFSEEAVIESNRTTAMFPTEVLRNNFHVEGIKIIGDLGPLLIVRHNNADIDAAIRVRPLNSLKRRRWLVADNFIRSLQGLDAPPHLVDRIGNMPGGLTYQDVVGRLPP